VAILDADKEGFLRSAGSLVQTAGRAARNVEGTVIFYAETITRSMQEAINETNRRRSLQMAYNKEHGITPESIVKSIEDVLSSVYEKDYYTVPVVSEDAPAEYVPRDQIPALLVQLEKEMRAAAKSLEFERAAELRDKIRALEQRRLGIIQGHPHGGDSALCFFQLRHIKGGRRAP